MGNVVERYAYDPWGARRNPADWTQRDSRTNWIVNRGYTGHEHLDAFCIINMNGRVYDPLTAQFFSPDPYVQAPGNWVNYNRYGYAYGNPFKYTDPSGEFFFFLMPKIGFDQNGGLTIGLTAGLGLPGFGLSASFSYGLKSHDWSATAGVSAGIFNAYAGYSSSGGFMAGYGVNAFNMGGGFSSNMTGFEANWSQKGGWSENMFGMQMSQKGVNFDPSIGVSYIYEIENPTLVYSNSNSAQTTDLDGSSDSQNSTVNNKMRIHRLFSSSQAAYRYIIKNSKNHEVAAVYTIDSQILVFDATGNTKTRSKNYYLNNSSDVDINGRTVKTTGEVHSHPGNLDFSTNNKENLYNPLRISDNDWTVAGYYNSTISIIMHGNLYSNIYLPDYWNNKHYNLQGC